MAKRLIFHLFFIGLMPKMLIFHWFFIGPMQTMLIFLWFFIGTMPKMLRAQSYASPGSLLGASRGDPWQAFWVDSGGFFWKPLGVHRTYIFGTPSHGIRRDRLEAAFLKNDRLRGRV